MANLIIIVAIVGALVIWLQLFGIKIVAEKKANKELEHLLFDANGLSKKLVLNKIHLITKNRLTDKQAIDYFYKIKGLQVVNLNDPISYWTRKYLMSSTKIRLNYFEQVKFYETFLNFPDISGRTTGNVVTSISSQVTLTNAAQELIKTRNVAQSMA